MKKVYLPLTKSQKERGVIFSSTLSRCTRETNDDTIHEVFSDWSLARKNEEIKNLLDDSFFNNSPWKYNIVRR